jgi:glutamate-1-semialdehyde aminotransferase
LHRGYPLVAYSEDLFEAARLFCELTGHERMVFTQSGTEAVMWAVRIARAATGRKKLVILDGSYHGLSDAVLAFRDRKGGSMSAGLGMLQEFADQLIILDYGNVDQLQQIEAAADDIAAVLVEPIQSRFPSRQPLEYLRSLRTLTLEKGIVLVFDEMVTGFRAGPRGAEGFFKVKPDLSTYGKVAGGGMPTGIIAGLSKYMDYVDGGTWGFDDASMPSLRRTMMAGTHTQNSLKISATLAVCREMQRICGPGPACDGVSCECSLGRISKQTTALASEANAYFAEKRVPLLTEHFSSLFRFQVTDDPFGLTRELFFFLLRLQGVETSTSGNCFLTTAHTDADLREVMDAVKSSVDRMLEHGFFAAAELAEVQTVAAPAAAPIQTEPAHLVLSSATDPMQELKRLILADLQVAGAGVR